MARDVTNTNLTLESHEIILRPLVTEKGFHRAERYNVYAFEVNRLASKQQIKEAVEELFEVKVKSVNTQIMKGKPRRYRFRISHTKAWKKAFVKLHEDHRIDFF